jgi:hypothetical protein
MPSPLLVHLSVLETNLLSGLADCRGRAFHLTLEAQSHPAALLMEIVDLDSLWVFVCVWEEESVMHGEGTEPLAGLLVNKIWRQFWMRMAQNAT